MRSRTMVGGVVGLAALGTLALVATSADAYPPGSKLALAATSVTPNTNNDNFTVQLQVDNAPPLCNLVVSVNDRVLLTQPSGAATPPNQGVSVPLTVQLPPSRDSTSTIEVKTSCAPNKKEKAKTKVVLRRAKFDIDDECRKNKPCKIEAKNFTPGATVNFIFTQVSPGTGQITRSKQAVGDGTAKVEITFTSEGAWSAVATDGNVTANATVQVKKK